MHRRRLHLHGDASLPLACQYRTRGSPLAAAQPASAALAVAAVAALVRSAR
jgi:hypothetical protein